MTGILREKHFQTYFANYLAKPLKILLGTVLILFLFLLKCQVSVNDLQTKLVDNETKARSQLSHLESKVKENELELVQMRKKEDLVATLEEQLLSAQEALGEKEKVIQVSKKC